MSPKGQSLPPLKIDALLHVYLQQPLPHANTLPKDMQLLKFGQNLHLFGICFFT